MSSTKPSHDDDHLDFGKVEKEAKSLVSYDERYWLENDAKFRAVEQRVGTYEEFREIVKAAHLKPLEKEDKISAMGTFTQVWNQSALRDGSKGKSDDGSNSSSKVTACQVTVKIPQTGQQFLQHWRRECKTLQQKKEFLLTVGGKNAKELFKTEIAGGLMGEFVECLLHDFTDSNVENVVDLLEAFSTSQRFSLSMAFLSKQEKDNLSTMFKKLCCVQTSEELPCLEGRVSALKSLYSIE